MITVISKPKLLHSLLNKKLMDKLLVINDQEDVVHVKDTFGRVHC